MTGKLFRSVAVLAALAATPPASAQVGPPAGSAAAAVGNAIFMGCFLHASGASPITKARSKEVAASGFELVNNPPADTLSTINRVIPRDWGKPRFARAPSSEGQVFISAFDNGGCIIEARDVVIAPVIAEVRRQFETPGVPWQKTRPDEASGDRITLHYGMAVTPKGDPRRDIVVTASNLPISKTSGRGFELVIFEVSKGPVTP